MIVVLLVAFCIHGPLLLMQLPLGSYDANFHMFFASHYQHSWFDPWNQKWYAGFSQTTYPPLPQQWTALIANVTGLSFAYMIVQFAAIVLLVYGVYGYARIWVDDRSASYAALGSVFLGSLALIIYQAGQLSTSVAAPLYLLGLVYFYSWMQEGRFSALIKGVLLIVTAAAAHNATLLFGAILFALPLLALAMIENKDADRSRFSALVRAAFFAVVCGALVAVVLYPFWIALLHNPVKQMPIPHASRSNYLLHPLWGLNYFVVPYGALLVALPFMMIKGAFSRRLRPLLIGFWVAMLLGLGGTTPFPRWVLGRAYEVLTYERFTFWATLLALPLAGLVASRVIDRWGRKGAVALAVLAAATCSLGVAWSTWNRAASDDASIPVKDVASFLNRDGHDKYRYVTLGFGRKISELAVATTASTVDGEWNSARQLPELTQYGAGQFTSAKYFGTAGIESLKAMLKHADQYGLKWVFVHDAYYEPLLVFGGWRKIDTLQKGSVSIWSKDGVPPAVPMHYAFTPPAWHGLIWGLLPIGSSILTMLVLILFPDRRRLARVTEFPDVSAEPAAVGGAR